MVIDTAPGAGVGDCYVQVLLYEFGDAYAKAASNVYLTDRRLSPRQESTLLSLGWFPPRTLGEGPEPGRSEPPKALEIVPHPPNFHRESPFQHGQKVIADTLLATLNLVHGVQHPDQLPYTVNATGSRREREGA